VPGVHGRVGVWAIRWRATSSRRPFVSENEGFKDDVEHPDSGFLGATPRGEHSVLFRRMEGRTENFTPKKNSAKIYRWNLIWSNLS
jgi:hypothetical protein